MCQRIFLLCAAGLLAVWLVGCSSSRSTTRRIDGIAAWFKVEAQSSGAGEGGTTSVLAGPNTSRFLASGAASPEEPVPFGSVTKTLTAIMVLQCVDAGLFVLDDPVVGIDHPAGESITWRHLLEHRAGFVDRRLDPTSPEALIPMVPPGVLFLYSNEGYVVLARALESVTGESFPDRAQSAVFDPLGIHGIEFEVPGSEDRWSPSMGASGLFASPQKLAPFVEAVARQDRRLLTSDGWDELFELESWETVQLDGQSALVQEGRVTGRRSALLVFPKRRSALLVSYQEGQDTADDPSVPPLAERVQRRAIEDLGERHKRLSCRTFRLPSWISGKPPCSACDWTARWGVYQSPMSGEQLIIEDQNGGPILIDESGETLAIGPQLSDGRAIFHDLYKPITDVSEDSLMHVWPLRSGQKDVIEFGLRDGRVIGLLRGAEWFDKLGP